MGVSKKTPALPALKELRERASAAHLLELYSALIEKFGGVQGLAADIWRDYNHPDATLKFRQDVQQNLLLLSVKCSPVIGLGSEDGELVETEDVERTLDTLVRKYLNAQEATAQTGSAQSADAGTGTGAGAAGATVSAPVPASGAAGPAPGAPAPGDPEPVQPPAPPGGLPFQFCG